MDTIQQELLFTELTPEAAAVVEGGAGIDSFGSTINFDTSLSSRSFNVRPGGGITLVTSTKSGKNNRSFNAIIRNVKTGNTTPPKSVKVGNSITTQWDKIRGGTYKIDFKDTKDGIYVTGTIGVAYDT
ncbi:MAG: hypothetical protein RMZ43_000855 [Nostoc sp. CmiVER01]|nr:hypothetical protein [Nostoc sp. CmiVER01]